VGKKEKTHRKGWISYNLAPHTQQIQRTHHICFGFFSFACFCVAILSIRHQKQKKKGKEERKKKKVNSQ